MLSCHMCEENKKSSQQELWSVEQDTDAHTDDSIQKESNEQVSRSQLPTF